MYENIIEFFIHLRLLLTPLRVNTTFFKYWQLQYQQRQTNETKNGKLFRVMKFFFLIWWKPLWNQKLFLLTATALHSCYTLVRPLPTLSCSPFFTYFFGTNFRHQNKNNVVVTISCFVYQLSKKYCVSYVSEHLTYCTQINEYWLNKNACLNIVLEYMFIGDSYKCR